MNKKIFISLCCFSVQGFIFASEKHNNDHLLQQIYEQKDRKKAAIIVTCFGGALVEGSRRLLQVEYTQPSTAFCFPPVLVVIGCGGAALCCLGCCELIDSSSKINRLNREMKRD